MSSTCQALLKKDKWKCIEQDVRSACLNLEALWYSAEFVNTLILALLYLKWGNMISL